MKPLVVRQRRTAVAAAILVPVALLVAFVVPVPYVATEPGPVFDVLGESDGQQVVQISGATTYPTSGRLDMVTVSQFGGTSALTMGSAIVAWLGPNQTVEPKELRYGGADPQQEQEIDHAVFQASTSSALAAAASYLGRPVTSKVLVSQVEKGAPADGVLKSGDVVLAVSGTQVSTTKDLINAVTAQPAGSVVQVEYERDAVTSTASITSAARPDGSAGAYLGIVPITNYRSDFTAEVSLQGIGGPSAGMVFALAMVDDMTPGAMLDGGHVAGTGTIAADGRVGPIGGIEKKIVSVQRAGASLFLVPRGDCAELQGRIPSGLTVVPVDTLAAAIDSITAWRGGDGDLPTCS